ncbi:hypothetical protein, partial [Roseomonas sp. TAS13]|uniref:hypothetical protein n=1 Tax=Roseomonas sp. TAS13 TaxID=1926319 RepID=UPI001C0CD719
SPYGGAVRRCDQETGQMLRIAREAEGWRVAVELRLRDAADGMFRASPATVLRVSSGGGWSSATPLAAR